MYATLYMMMNAYTTIGNFSNCIIYMFLYSKMYSI